MRDVAIEQIAVARLVDEPAGDSELVLETVVQTGVQHFEKLLGIVVTARQRVLLQKAILVAALAQMLELLEYGKRRKAREPRILSGVQQHGAHFARAGADAAFVDRHAIGDRKSVV